MGNQQSSTNFEVAKLVDQYCASQNLLKSDYNAKSNGKFLVEDLNMSELKMVQKVWRHECSDVDVDIGVEIFKLIFTKVRGIPSLFGVPDFNPGYDDNLVSNGRFVSHTRVVKNAIDLFIDGLTDTSKGKRELDQQLRNLGAKHLYMRKDGFTPQYWYSFAEAMDEVVRKWEIPRFKRKKFKRVWRILVVYLVAQMRLGYEEELQKRKLSKDVNQSLSV